MATNNFLPFGGAAGANVLTQADYAALAARTAGFSSGTANSAQLNKVWRQSSIIAAVVAQFIADLSGQDAIDDGTTATLLNNLKSAVKAQSNAVVAQGRNLRMSSITASASATLTADEVVLASALGGQTYRLAAINKTVNLATTGAGGMDTGLAPVTGFVALYLIYNPALGLSGANPALLGVNASASIAPEVYGGANMPSGYTASALVAVLPTDTSRLITPHILQDRKVSTPYRSLAAPTSNQPVLTLFNPTSIPFNAKRLEVLFAALSSSQPAVFQLALSPTAAAIGSPALAGANSVASNGLGYMASVPVLTPQNLYYSCTCSAGTPTFNFGVIGYEF